MKKHILKPKIILLILILIGIKTQAQTASISGIIKDNGTGQVIENVLISTYKTNNHSHTDADGKFNLISLSAGVYELDFSKMGYETKKLSISLMDNEIKQLDVALIFNPTLLLTVDIEMDRPVSAASSAYLSQKDFENRPKNSAQDMLRLVPGLFIAQHAGGGKSEQIFIRGFDADHGTDVATFVDGIPVNMPGHGHGQGYADLHFLIPEVVAGMNIFKGTSSPLYGDFATGAAVDFKTLDTLQNNLIQLETGSVTSKKVITGNRALALLQLPIKNSNVSSYFAADIINNRGFFDASQDFKRVNVFSKTTIALNENSQIRFSLTGFGSSWNASGQIPERGVSQGIIGRFGSIDPLEGGTTQRNNYNLIYTAKLGSGELEAQAYVSTYRFKLFSNFTFFLNDSVNGDMIEQGDNRTVRGLNTKYTLEHKFFNMDNKFTLGTSFRADDIENQLWQSPGRNRIKVNAHALIYQRSNSVFVNEVFRFNNHFRAELGLRYEYFIFDVDDLLPIDSSHQNYSGFNYQTALNPKLNLIYAVNNSMQFFFNSGKGFHSNDPRSSVQEKSQHQLPQAVSAEFGTLLQINSKTVVSAAVWAMDLSNELVYVGDDGTTENKGASRRVGIDLSGRAQLFSWLYVDADLNLSKGRFIDTIFGSQLKTDFYIPLAPALTSAGGLTLKLKNSFECSLRYRYMKKRPGDESNTIIAHGYNVFDFTANYKIKQVKLGLVVENLLDVDWNEAQFATETKLRTESQAVDELHFTPGTPFSAKVTIGYIF